MKKAFKVIAVFLFLITTFLVVEYNQSETFDSIIGHNTQLDNNNLVSIEILTQNLDTYVITDIDKIKEFTIYMNGFQFKKIIRNSIINTNVKTSPSNMAYKVSIIDINGNKVSIAPDIPIMKINGEYYKITSGEINKNFFINLIQ